MADLARAITNRVLRARSGEDPSLLARMPSGWAIFAKQQPDAVTGGCMLLPDPVVPSANALGEAERQRFFADMVRLGDAIARATGCERVNYLVLCNRVPELHAHCVPRFASEDPERRLMDPFEAYDFASARLADPDGQDKSLVAALRAALAELLAGGR